MPNDIVYRSESNTETAVARDIYIVVRKCVDNIITDKASNAKTILFWANATNGYMEIYFGDVDDLQHIGTSQYILELPELFKIKDADLFDGMTKGAAILFSQSEFGQQIKRDFKLAMYDDFYEVTNF